MSSQLRILNGMLRTLVKPAVPYMGLHPNKIRRNRALINNIAALFPVPEHIVIHPFRLGTLYSEWVSNHMTSALSSNKVILYLHGGAYLLGSPITHRTITTRLAHYAQSRVFAVNYRKAPEYPYPHALNDALYAYEWLLSQGIAPNDIVIAGDSAGGNLTLVTLLAIRDKQLPLPASGICLSPWGDLTARGNSPLYNRALDPMIPTSNIRGASRLYANGIPLEDPRLSPVFADLAGLPPLLIHVGENEVVLSDSTRLAANAVASGVDIDLKIWPNAPHVFQLFAGFVPQANQSLQEIGQYIKQL